MIDDKFNSENMTEIKNFVRNHLPKKEWLDLIKEFNNITSRNKNFNKFILKIYKNILNDKIKNEKINKIQNNVKDKIHNEEVEIKKYEYDDYDDYLKNQKEAYDKKRDKVWTEESDIKCVSEYIKKFINPSNGICHGVRTGKEIIWFRKYLNDCDVIGTELNEKRNEYVVKWDFNNENSNWINKFDFVYSNSYDHSFDIHHTMDTWKNQLSDKGIIVLEYNHDHTIVDSWDPTGIDKENLIKLLKTKFKNVHCYSNESNKHSKRVKRFPNKEKFIIIGGDVIDNNEYKCSIVSFDYNHSFDKLLYNPKHYNCNNDMYKRLSNTLLKSIKKNTPQYKIDFFEIEPPDYKNYRGINTKPSWANNVLKLEKWNETVQNSNTGDKVVLLDCDTLVMKDFSSVFDDDFNIAFTDKPNPKGTFNGGVIFVNINDISKEFFNIFLDINYKMIENIQFHMKYRNLYSGMNQSAMGYMYETYYKNNKTNKYNLKIIPGKLYNQSNMHYWKTGEIGYIIHYMSILRHYIFIKPGVKNSKDKYADIIKKLDINTKNNLKKFADIWHEYEQLDI